MLDKFGAMLHEVRLGFSERNARSREHQALRALGRAVSSSASGRGIQISNLVSDLVHEQKRIDVLRARIAESLDEDRVDYAACARWMRPLVVVRGLCTRAIIRHRVATQHRQLAGPEIAIGAAASNQAWALDQHASHVQAVVDARAVLRRVVEERRGRLDAVGGSAWPEWTHHLKRESIVLARAFWLQLRPHILPRGSALAGLTVGWWLANTYTDSHFRSVLHSLGIGSGGKRVVSGETYKAMMFWLPIFAAAVFAYAADRAHHLLERRYSRTTPPS